MTTAAISLPLSTTASARKPVTRVSRPGASAQPMADVVTPAALVRARAASPAALGLGGRLAALGLAIAMSLSLFSGVAGLAHLAAPTATLVAEAR